MFSTLKPGATLYILDKSNGVTLKLGNVVEVGRPRVIYNNFMQTIVDITVKINNENKDFVGVPGNQTKHSYGAYVISESREEMLAEVETILQNSKDAIESIDRHKKNIEDCKKILNELNPAYAKDLQRDSAIEDLTLQVNNMLTVLTRLESLFAKNTKNEDN